MPVGHHSLNARGGWGRHQRGECAPVGYVVPIRTSAEKHLWLFGQALECAVLRLNKLERENSELRARVSKLEKRGGKSIAQMVMDERISEGNENGGPE